MLTSESGIGCEVCGAAVGTGGGAARGSGVGVGSVVFVVAAVGFLKKRYFDGGRSDGVPSLPAIVEVGRPGA